MKNINIPFIPKYFCILLLLSFLQGCSDFLEQEPGAQVSLNEQLSTTEGVLMALTGAYGTLEANLRGERFAVYGDVMGGNIKFSPVATGNSRGQISVPSFIEKTYSFQDDAMASDFSTFYDESYEIINQANLILEYTDALPDASDNEKAQIKAEALALRAFAHYNLTLVYAQNYSYTAGASHPGIIYLKESLDDLLTYPARETVAVTYDLILEDMAASLELMQDDSALPGPVYSYFNANNVKALMARIYLSQNNWQSAFDFAEEVIATSGVDLVSTEEYIAEWEKPQTPISEILMELSPAVDQEGAIGGSLAQQFGYEQGNFYGKYVASQDLLDLYEEGDIRGKDSFLEISLPTVVNGEMVDENYYFTKKFQDAPGYPVIRLSEMYLIKAEAALELGNVPAALTAINIIKERANSSSIIEVDDLEKELLNERRREFAFEGHLFFDLGRRQESIVRMDGCIATLCNLDFPSARFVLPIPQKNIDLNQNLEQNEDY